MLAAMATNAPLLNEPLPVELMNTVWADRDGVHDALRDPGGTHSWLTAVAPRLDVPTPQGLGALADGDLDEFGRRLIGLRDALRRLAAEATADHRPAAASDTGDLGAAVSALNEAAGATPSWPVLAWSPGREPAQTVQADGPPAAAAVSAIAGQAVALFGGDGRRQLHACFAPGCVLYFVKNHPRREWCSTACGNRARAARHYRRHRQAAD
jgi:predicted RNA-binding Zn ribbon-like protein